MKMKHSPSRRLSLFLRLVCLSLALLMLALTGCTPKPDPEQGDTPNDPNDPEQGDTPNDPNDPEQSAAPTELRVNLLSQPFGLDRSSLRFSWAMGQNDGAYDQKQAAYRIVVATSAARMDAADYLYDSAWVESAENTAVTLTALHALLEDNALYYWSVATRDTAGKESALSAPQAFSTAVGEDWADVRGMWADGGSGGVAAPTSDDWSDYTVDVTFAIDSNALGFALRANNPSNFYMWQFKVENGKAMLYPHVFQNGSFVGNKAIYAVEVPDEVSFGIGDTIRARMVCEGDTISTYLADANGDYVLIDEGDVSAYGFQRGVIGVRTGGSETGRVTHMSIYNHLNEHALLYESAFALDHNPFSKCSLVDGALSVPKALSTANLLDTAALQELTGVANGKSGHDFVFLRGELELSEERAAKLDRALLSVTALSPENTRQYVYNMYVNGTEVGVGPTRLGTSPDGRTTLSYDTYDVTSLLNTGKNALAAINYATVGRAFLCQLTLHYTDGTSEIVHNSARDAASWRALEGDKIFGKENSIGTKYYAAHANNLDSTLYPHGFTDAAYNASSWSEVRVSTSIADGMLLVPAMTDIVSRYERPAAAVTQLEDGSYVVDLGREIVGGLRLTIDLPNAATLTLDYGEQLEEDGSVRSQMLTGNQYTETWKLVQGEQTLQNISMMTYRYLQISGSPVAITKDMVTGLEIRTAFDAEASSLTSDNALLNDIYALMKHTIMATTQHLYVDSQSRERLPYEGDVIVNLPASYPFGSDYSIGRASAEYLYTHRTWPAEYYLFTATFALQDYMTTGDLSSLDAYYDIIAARTYTDRISDTYGLLTTNNTTSSSTDAVLVDWPLGERDGYDINATYNTVLNAVAVQAYDDLAAIATALGKSADAKSFSNLADDLRYAMIDQLYDAQRGAFCDGLHADGTPSEHFSQHATAFALACGIYENQEMADRLAATIREQGSIRMSVYGAYFLLKGLYDSGNGAIANQLLLDDNTAKNARTWAKMLYTLDATITTEAWGESNKNNMTFSHPWGAAPAYAIMSGIFGIQPTSPGYATFDVRLQNEGVGNEASIRVPTIKGEIAVSYQKEGDTCRITLHAPANTLATLYVPAGEGATLSVESAGTVNHVYENGCFKIELGSGTHTFIVK